MGQGPANLFVAPSSSTAVDGTIVIILCFSTSLSSPSVTVLVQAVSANRIWKHCSAQHLLSCRTMAMFNGRLCLPPPAPPQVLKMYKYKNASLPYDAVLSTCKGKIFFQSPYGGSGWHGEVTMHGDMSTMGLMFNYRGNLYKLHHCLVSRVANGVWSGVDYKGRIITMEQISEYLLCEDGITWQPIIFLQPRPSPSSSSSSNEWVHLPRPSPSSSSNVWVHLS